MIPFREVPVREITEEQMERVYQQIKTPHKHGAVMKWEDCYTDSATVFLKDGVFYMYFIAISKDCNVSGYETHLARSEDLLHWEYIGPIFRRDGRNRWDSKQCAGYAAFMDIRYDGTYSLEQVGGRYSLSYLAGNSDGYEPDPLFMGLARSADPTDADGFERLENPILSPGEPDCRPYETKTLYKSDLFRDPLNTTGYPYVNVYNAKGEDNKERIFLAVSDDGVHWERYGDHAVIDLATEDPDELICGDPQMILMEDLYIMLFFRCRRGEPAFDTFACSYDLIHWKVWEGEPLIQCEEDWEDLNAHKPWFVRVNGRNYHFYCAVNSKNERFIALATSD
jgi:predicted GH43/DUF377 family glycosyl hydrolase